MLSKAFVFETIVLILFIRTSYFVAAENGWANSTFQPSGNNSFCKVSNGIAECKLHNITHLPHLLKKENNVTNLDVSGNLLRLLPEKSFCYLRGLKRLSLAFNEIQVLAYEVFHGLDNLEILNVSYNPLRYFIGEVKAVFPSLDLVDLTGVKSWTPDNQLAKIFSLKKIFGFSFGKSCSNCMLFLPEIFEDIPFRYEYKSGNCHLMHYDLSGVLTKLIKLDSDFRFQLHCHFPRKCFEAHLDAEIDNSEVHNLCWENSLVMLKVVGAIGIAGLIINLLVALNIICSKKLRENISMLFVCNMSVSDFLLSLFSLCLLVYSSSHSYDQLHRITRATNWKIGFLWVLGLCGSVITSFYLTLERYLVIVYTMNPNIRICRRLAYFMILVCWLIAIFVTGYALYYKFYSQSTFCIPIRVNYSNSNSHIFKYSIFTGSSGLVFSILSFILYIHIYIFAKRSANNLGVKRESNVAKQIAFLVFSNIFFYCFPLIINGVIAVALSDPFKTINHVSLLLSITMNSFVNPFLHAFRNGRFQKVLKSRIQQFGVAL